MPIVGEDTALRVSDPDLPLLASEAAIEIDNLLSGRSSGLGAVERLGARMRYSVGGSGREGARSMLDPATLTVLGAAVNEVSRGTPLVADMDALIHRAGQIASDLTKRDPQSDRVTLEWVRAFCVALSRCAAAYRKSIYDLRPQHPFKRLTFVGS